MLTGSLGERKSSTPSNPHSRIRKNSRECRSFTCVVQTMVFTPYFMWSNLPGFVRFGPPARGKDPSAREPAVAPASFLLASRPDWLGAPGEHNREKRKDKCFLDIANPGGCRLPTCSIHSRSSA